MSSRPLSRIHISKPSSEVEERFSLRADCARFMLSSQIFRRARSSVVCYVTRPAVGFLDERYFIAINGDTTMYKMFYDKKRGARGIINYSAMILHAKKFLTINK